MSMQNSKKTGVILMTYGSATTAEHVQEYFDHIYVGLSQQAGKASAELIEDFKHRYELIGHSPLVEITKKQAELLQNFLGDAYVVRAGMRHSAPFIQDAALECKAVGATKLIGIILSPQFSSFIMEGYKTAFMKAAAASGFTGTHSADSAVRIAGHWEVEPHFIDLLAKRVEESLAKLTKEFGAVPVIFTTHSLPKRVVEKDPSYLTQLQATIDAVLQKLEPRPEWYAAYQSAGHTPEQWLKPDLTDILAHLRDKTPAVLIVPIQFLSDHLEVLYDLDIAAKKQCEEFGLAYNRIELPNIDPLFIESLAALATR